MAIKAFSELQAAECVAHAEVENAVNTGALAWSGGNPGLAAGYCYTRADFEAYIQHTSMAGSGIASGELMSRSEMETYRQVLSIVSATPGGTPEVLGTWQGNVTFTVSAQVNSVRVAASIDGGSFVNTETLNVTPGSSGNKTSDIGVATGRSLEVRLTPYSGSNGGGTAGTPLTVWVPEPQN